VEKLSVKPRALLSSTSIRRPHARLHDGGEGVQRSLRLFPGRWYEVIGVSVDTEEKHDEFRSECGLRFPLASDPGAELTKSLDLLKQYGDHGWFAARVTYLLDEDAVVQQVWDVEDAGAHPDEVLAAVTE